MPETRSGETVPLLAGVTKTYGGPARRTVVLRDFSLSMLGGRRLAILAPNASGKSTLLRLLLGLELPDAGQVCLPVTPADRMGAVLQNYREQLVPWADVQTNLLIALGGRHKVTMQRERILGECRAVLSDIGYAIDFRQPVAALSGGQQQAVVLARALALGSRMLIWDEPTSALDVQRRIRLHELLRRRFRREDPVLVLVTHDVDEALALAEEAVLFDTGLGALRRVRTDFACFDLLLAYRESTAYRTGHAALSGWA